MIRYQGPVGIGYEHVLERCYDGGTPIEGVIDTLSGAWTHELKVPSQSSVKRLSNRSFATRGDCGRRLSCCSRVMWRIGCEVETSR